MNILSENMEIEIKDKRTRVLSYALHLFVIQGVQQTSMAQLSKDSDVATGTIYHYFKSKDELIEALFLEIKRNMAEAIALSEVEKTLSLKSRFELIWRKAYHFYITNPKQFIFSHTQNYSPTISAEIRNEARADYLYAVCFYNEGIEKGVFRNIDTLVLFRWVYNNIITLVQLKLTEEIDITPEIVNQAIKMSWKGIRV